MEAKAQGYENSQLQKVGYSIEDAMKVIRSPKAQRDKLSAKLLESNIDYTRLYPFECPPACRFKTSSGEMKKLFPNYKKGLDSKSEIEIISDCLANLNESYKTKIEALRSLAQEFLQSEDVQKLKEINRQIKEMS